MEFLSFDTQVEDQRFGLPQYLISHRPSLVYLEVELKTLFPKFGIYQIRGCYTHKNIIFVLTTFISSELLYSLVNGIIILLLLWKIVPLNFSLVVRVYTEFLHNKFVHSKWYETTAAHLQLHICIGWKKTFKYFFQITCALVISRRCRQMSLLFKGYHKRKGLFCIWWRQTQKQPHDLHFPHTRNYKQTHNSVLIFMGRAKRST
jgi:hypothetical protein